MTLAESDPRTVGGYRLEGRLGAGGMGVVYRARSVSGRQVAIKVIRPDLAGDGAFRARFRQEVAAARLVSGAFTAPVVDADPDADEPWLATLFVPGPSLADAVATYGPLDAPGVRRLAAGLVEALRDIHRAGLIHRDLKPGNVLLAEDGPRVIDFGIARVSDAAPLTSTGLVVGTPPFMAPEQFRNEPLTPAADVFALGSVLVYAATGHGPFDAESTHAVGFRVVYEEPDLAGVAPELRPLVDSCLVKDPAGRATVDRLLSTLAGPAVPPPPAATPTPPPATVVDPPAPGVADRFPVTGARPAGAPDPRVARVPAADTPPESPAPPQSPTRPASPPGDPRPSPVGHRGRRRALFAAAAVALAAAATAVAVPLLANGDGKAGDGKGADRAASPAADLAPAPCGPAGALRGAGSSVQKPALDRWAADHARRCQGSEVSYQPIGSGAGLTQFLSGQTDFAVVDTPLTAAHSTESAARCGGRPALQLPLDAVPIAVVYRLEGVDSLTLDAQTLAGIFDRKILRWNDSAIARLNPGVMLPDTELTTVVPAAASSITLGFTQYLAGAAPAAWPHQPATTLLTGSVTAAKDQVAEVAQTQGSISFTALSGTQGRRTAALMTAAGAPVPVGPDSAALALAAAAPVAKTGGAPLSLDPATRTPGAYPVVQVAYTVVCEEGNRAESLPRLRAFLDDTVNVAGRKAVIETGYAALPEPLALQVRRTAQGLRP